MRPSSVAPARAVALVCWLALPGCAGPGAPAAAAAPSVSPPAPITTVTGCVESRELHDYVASLETERAAARAEALSALGMSAEERRGSFGEPGSAALDSVVSEGERRRALVAMLAAGFAPVASLARDGHVLHRIDERPRAHPAPVLSCSERRCPSPAASPTPRGAARPLWIDLGPGESLGAPITLSFDYWWADVSYASSERCPAASASSR